MKYIQGLQPLGELKIPVVRSKYVVITGGPYLARPTDMIGVKMAAEIKAPYMVNIPTPDFQTPAVEVLQDGLHTAVEHIVQGDPVYVGCMAGKGRTGLFLAVLAKAFGIDNPVEFVRENYYAHAVETKGQYKFVENFEPLPETLKAIRWFKIKSFFRFKSCLTNGVA